MIQIKSDNIYAFGGIHLIHKDIIEKKLIELINERLGVRGKTAVYQFSDMILSKIYTCFAGGQCAENIKYLKEGLFNLKHYKVSSPDNILQLQKDLSTENELVESSSGNLYNFNNNDKLNKLLVEVAVYLGLVEPDQAYTLDFDHQLMPCNKAESKLSYKMKNGFFPGFATINGLPLFCENRDGNCHVKTGQLATIKKIVETLFEAQIDIARLRLDSGSYFMELTDYVEDDIEKLFYIRANQCAKALQAASQLTDYQTIRIGTQIYEASSFDYEFGKHTHRRVVYRQKNKSGQLSAITQDDYNYFFILTNDKDWTEKQVIEFYNQRGASEKVFDELNNDFNSKHLPFSQLNYNTVHLILSCLTMLVYKWLISKYSRITGSALKATDRIKKFKFLFINRLCFKVVETGRYVITKIFKPESMTMDLSGFT